MYIPEIMSKRSEVITKELILILKLPLDKSMINNKYNKKMKGRNKLLKW